MTRKTCAFTAACGRERRVYLESLALRARSCSSRLATRSSTLRSRTLGQLLFRNGADRAALGSPLELRHHFAHHSTDVLCSAGDCCAYSGAKLVLAHASRQVCG